MVRAFARRKSTSVSIGNAKAVLKLLQKKHCLSKKQAEYCNELCIQRILRSRGDNVKKAAKQLRATLAWRESLDIDWRRGTADNLTADEFSCELASGAAYVAGQDDEHRPVLKITLKPELHTNQSQRQFFRFVVFTMEVAIAMMHSDVEQCVIILDAACLTKGPPGLSTPMQLLRMLGDHYPERLARAFLVDAPLILYYLWKGIGPLIDLGMREKLRFAFSKNYIASAASGANHVVREDTSHLSCNISVIPNSRQSLAAALVTDEQQARSLSFASPTTAQSCWLREPGITDFRSSRFDTGPLQNLVLNGSRREEQEEIEQNQKERNNDIFKDYLSFYTSSYNEAAYRAIMKPPLRGLASIVSTELKRQPEFCFRATEVQIRLHHLNIG